MKICLLSDTHGYLVKIPECDLVIHAGDFSPYHNHDRRYQELWHNTNFIGWIEELKCKNFIYCAGNHDWLFYNSRSHEHKPFKDYSGMKVCNSKRIYLENDKVEIDGLTIFSFPWQLPFYDWAFNAPEDELRSIYSKVDKADIIISHGPPYGYGDPGYKEPHVGSKALVELIDRVKPKLVVTGHLHSGYGLYQRNETTIVNAAPLNEKYELVREPILIELET